MNIRKATPEDLETIQRLGHELLEYERLNFDPSLDTNWPFSEAGKEKYRSAILDKYTLITLDSDRPVGYLIGSLHLPPTESARHLSFGRIENIYVHPDFRGQGIGKTLFENFRNYCKANQINRLEVLVNAKNTSAIDFYHAVNFVPLRLTLSQDL